MHVITEKHPIRLDWEEGTKPYTPVELNKLFAWAREHDVQAGGIYDARSAAIIVWSDPWTTPEGKRHSEPIYSFFFAWGEAPCLVAADVDQEPYRHTISDAMRALGALELAALGRVKHGKE